MAGMEPKLVVALEARLNKFETQMKEAGLIADRGVKQIEDRFARANPSLGGNFLTGIAGGLLSGVALDKLLRGVIELNKQVVELGETARRTGLDFQRIQELKFAANTAGLSDQTFTSGIEKMAERLNDSVRNENELSRLFEANNVSLKDREGQLLSVNDALLRGAQLIRDARTEQDKIKIAEMLGLSREWVKVLEQGPDAFDKIARGASAAGATIDKKILEAAQKFDRDWNAATTRWATDLKAALAEILPLVSSVLSGLSAIAGVVKAIKDFSNEFGKAQRATEFGSVTDPKKIQENLEAELERRRESQKGKFPAFVPPSQGTTNVPAKETGGVDPFERASISIAKHIAALEADAAAVGKTAGEHARLRTEAQLTEAILQSGGTVTEEYAAKIGQIADRAAKAADALASRRADFEQFNSIMRFGGSQLVDIFDAIGDKSKSMADVVRSSLHSIKRALLELVLTGGGPFGRASATGGIGGLIGALFPFPSRDVGGQVTGGQSYEIGKGPYKEIFTPKMSGVVSKGRGSGGVTINISNNPVFATDMSPGDRAVINQDMQRNNLELEARITRNLRTGLRNDSNYLSAG